MAKKAKEELPEEAPVVSTEEVDNVEVEAPEETVEQVEVQAKVATVKSGVVSVKVQIVEPVDCIIAGIPYKYQKDRAVSVPSDVAAVLVNARKAYRI